MPVHTHTHTHILSSALHTRTQTHTLHFKRHVYSVSNVLLCFISSVTFCKHQGIFQSIAYTTITLNTQENYQMLKHIICKQLMDPKNVFLSTRMRILSIKDKPLGTICVQTDLLRFTQRSVPFVFYDQGPLSPQTSYLTCAQHCENSCYQSNPSFVLQCVSPAQQKEKKKNKN